MQVQDKSASISVSATALRSTRTLVVAFALVSPMQPAPSLAEFQATCREAFAYLQEFGFAEVPAPAHRRADPFELWFGAGDRFVVVRGEGYGTSARVSLEHVSGVRLAPVRLVPGSLRPAPLRRHSDSPGQLEIIRANAAWLQTHGEDFLRGELTRFLSMAEPLPPYLRQGDV